jgi:hypothetical protein
MRETITRIIASTRILASRRIIELVDDYDMVVIPTFSDNRVVATKLIY